MAQVPLFYSLIFIFRSNLWHFITLANISPMVRSRANITISIRQKVRHLPSNVAIANVVHRDLHGCFQGHTISGNHIILIWKTLGASKKCSSTSFIEVDTSYRNVPLPVLHISALAYIFKVTQFLKIYKYTIS